MDRDDIILAKLEKIDTKQDEMADRISLIEITLAKNTKDIEHHIKRTDLLEEHINGSIDTIKSDMKPINDHVTFIKNIGKLIAVLAAILTFLKTMGIV